MSFSKEKVFSNLIWRFLERSGAQFVALIVSVVLARILSPEDYGTIALITVFINILNVFVDSGLGSALIQKKDADNTDFSTVFYTNVIFCIALYILMFVISPFLAEFYSRPELVSIIRVLSITILVSGVKSFGIFYINRNQCIKFWLSILSIILICKKNSKLRLVGILKVLIMRLPWTWRFISSLCIFMGFIKTHNQDMAGAGRPPRPEIKNLRYRYL